jgi:electron transfer flavoprotein beta subunit
LDARAVELGLRLVGSQLRIVHAGDPQASVLRDYMGMGVAELTVFKLPPEADALPALTAYFEKLKLDLILLGLRGEGGEDSGLLPYQLAEALGLPVVANVVELTAQGNSARLLQALPRGQRRAVMTPLPCVAAVDWAAPAPRQSAFGLARRGRIVVEKSAIVMDAARAGWEQQPARKRPKRLKVVKAKSAAERFQAATGVQGGGGKILHSEDPRQAAQAIYDYLRAEGVVKGLTTYQFLITIEKGGKGCMVCSRLSNKRRPR